MKTIVNIFIFIIFFVCLPSCKKYLDKKPQQNLVVPSTLQDLRALLDNGNLASLVSETELLSDNIYVTTQEWQQYLSSDNGSSEALSYVWDRQVFYPSYSWTSPYQVHVYISNVVLYFLTKIDAKGDVDERNALKGTALFFRAFAYERLAQIYCKPYNSSSDSDPGIVLKQSYDINEKITRSTVQQTYDQIINDLKEAAELLPLKTLYPTRPDKAAAYGELARTYLWMRDYANAGKYSNLSLEQNNSVLDYNTLTYTGATPIPVFNTEISSINSCPVSPLVFEYAKITPALYNSYSLNDLRKVVYFKENTGTNAGTYSFKGSYYGPVLPNSEFSGITVSEILLIRAECFARSGDVLNAMNELNSLLIKRWKTGTFVPLMATDALDAKNKVLSERRKELVFRGQRWSDLRRLNLEGANITLTREIAGTTYSLPANDKRWVVLIPQEVINRSGLQQNQR